MVLEAPRLYWAVSGWTLPFPFHTPGEVSAWLRGDTPTTWGTRWWLGADPVPQPRRTERHPYCGCAWWDGGWWDEGRWDDGWAAG